MIVELFLSERNHVWICDLRGEAQFEGWLTRSGLSIEEAGRIHGPPITWKATGGGAAPTPGDSPPQPTTVGSPAPRVTRGGVGWIGERVGDRPHRSLIRGS